MADQLHQIIQDIESEGGKPYFVGGVVRDWIILGKKGEFSSHVNNPDADIDIEVFNLNLENLLDILEQYGVVSQVGKCFGVLKLSLKSIEGSLELDFSLPRLDNNTGVGHKDFSVELASDLTPEQAACRRDFTMNSLFCDYEGSVYDPYGGQSSIEKGVLSATSSQFSEDPLRVLRAMQFVSRFDLDADDDLIDKSQSMGVNDCFKSLSIERIKCEWTKWAVKSKVPSKGLLFFRDANLLRFFPEISSMIGIEQDRSHHPEGCVFTHSCHVVDQAAIIANREQLSNGDRTVLLFAALCHDMGKPSTIKIIDGKITTYGHDREGVQFAESFLLSIGIDRKYILQISSLVAEHMVHCGIANPSDRLIRRLALRIRPSNIRLLSLLVEADHSGRPPLERCLPVSMKQIVDKAESLSLDNKAPRPILQGRHLISEFGLRPGPDFSRILGEVFDQQVAGSVKTLKECLDFASNMI